MNGTLLFFQRPKTRIPVTPQFKDHFAVGPNRAIWFTRDKGGRVEKLHIGIGRMRDLEFLRVVK